MLFQLLLPPTIYVAEMDPALANPNFLFPAETAIISGANEQRRLEFTAGRHLARQLLNNIGLKNQPLLSGSDRAPIWPAGIIGSITHCSKMCAVALAKQSNIKGIGIDIELSVTLTIEAENILLTAIDKNSLTQLIKPYQAIGSCLVFSAKESVYKAVYPLTKEFIEYTDINILFGKPGTFQTTPMLQHKKLSDSRIEGFYSVFEEYIATAVIIRSR